MAGAEKKAEGDNPPGALLGYPAIVHRLFIYQNRLSCDEFAVLDNALVAADHEDGSSAAVNPTVLAVGVTEAAGIDQRPSFDKLFTSV